MLSAKEDTIDSISLLDEDGSRCSSIESNINAVLALPLPPGWSISDSTVLSPPPIAATKAQASAQPKAPGVHVRLRSDSGLSFDTNRLGFRRYTDYNADGSMRSSDNSPSLSTKAHSEAEEYVVPRKALPDFFDPAVMRLAFADPTTSQRMNQFASSSNSVADIEFLVKVDEYSKVFSNLKSLISQISWDFTGVTATMPVDLPMNLSNSHRNSMRQCVGSALPLLEKLYRDAKSAVEERLAQRLYPGFVKHQLSQCMRSSLSVSRSQSGAFKSAYPGLGEAFCITDPLVPDNPIVFASDALLDMTGFKRSEIIQKNCRFLQGISTDAASMRRLSEAILTGRAATELLINYRKDGTPFWNLLFICPLMENGNIRYYLGAQVNVSESMGSDYKDIFRILSFGFPGEDVMSPGRKPFQRSRQPAVSRAQPNPETEPADSVQGARETTHRSRFFRRFSRNTARPTISIAKSTPSEPTEKAFFSTKRRVDNGRSPEWIDLGIEESSTPYSRFMVMRYLPPVQGHHAVGEKRNCQPRMPVAFCSPFASSLLGIKSEDIANIVGQEIFGVLSSGDITPVSGNHASFRTAVVEKMTAGEPLSVDLKASVENMSSDGAAVKTLQQKQTRQQKQNQPQQNQLQQSLKRFSSKKGSITRSSRSFSLTDDDDYSGTTQHSRLNDKLDRGAGILSHVLFGSKMKKLMSHWTPLKNGDGKVEWVVLILTPTTT